MKKKDAGFQESAETIGEEMEKWDSFGVVYDGNGDSRLFCAGNLENIIDCIAAGLHHLIELTGRNSIQFEILMRLNALIDDNKKQLLM